MVVIGVADDTGELVPVLPDMILEEYASIACRLNSICLRGPTIVTL